MIRKFSILSSTLVRDLLAWMRLIAVPADNVACARVLAAPYWGLEPRDLVRLAERAEKNHRRPLWDEVESAHREPPLDREGVRLPELVQLLNQMRQSARSKTASALLDELIAEARARTAGFGGGPAISRPAGRIREGMGAEKRSEAAARFHRVPRLLRRAGRRRADRGGAVRGRGAVDDRARGERAGVSARVHPAAQQERLPFRRAAAGVRISAGADEGRAAARRIFTFRRSGGCFTWR